VPRKEELRVKKNNEQKGRWGKQGVGGDTRSPPLRLLKEIRKKSYGGKKKRTENLLFRGGTGNAKKICEKTKVRAREK